MLGPGGAGKSTLSIELGRILGLPVIHLDRHYWRPGWIEPSDDDWFRIVSELVEQDSWIIDGNYSGTLHLRLARAQAAILLDPPALQCLVGVIRRGVFNRPRPDLADGCDDHFPDFEFLRYVATYKRLARPRVLNKIDGAPHVRFHHFRSRRAAIDFVHGLNGAAHPDRQGEP